MSTGAAGRPAGGTWPSVADYNEAVQNLHASMGDVELRAGLAMPGPLGVPMPYSGGFADVYRVDCPATGNTWAVKFFKREVRGLRERYQEISQHLRQARLPFMVDFHYLEDGVRIAGRSFPIVKLRWVEGLTLNQFVMQSLDQPRMLDQLLHLWVKVASRLRAANIAHADLQYGNVMLVPRDDQGHLLLKLIDYDGMWVPALAGRPSGEAGHRHFQHPQRAANNAYSADVDRFSHLAICCALRCLSIGGRPLWDRFDNGDNLLFAEADFANPAGSALFRELWTLRHPDARALVGRLVLATQGPLEQAPQIDELVVDGRVRPLDDSELRAARALLEPTGAARATLVVPTNGGVGPTTAAASSEPSRPNAVATVDDSTSGSPRKLPGRQQVLRTATACALVLVAVLAALSIRWIVRGANERTDVAQTNRAGDTDGVSDGLPENSTGAAGGGAAVKKLDLSDTITLTIGIELRRISAGEFLMGAATGNPDEQPAHRVRITRPFYLGTHEVTRAQYLTVMGNNASTLAWADRPVTNVSWDEAQEFCRRLTEREGESLPAGWAFRLPTEAEWEYACRADGEDRYGFVGDAQQVDEYAWHKGNANGGAQAVGQKKPNAWGLYDMHGNVWEWCQDPYDAKYYAASPVADPNGPASGSERVRRGGSWRAAPEDCRSSFRFKCDQTRRYDDNGFRVAFGPSDPASGETSQLASADSAGDAPSASGSPANAPPPLAVVPFNEAEAKQHQEAWARHLGQPVEKEITLPGGEKLVMMLIPPGEFSRSEDNQPSFRVRLTKPFYLGKYEVTQAQWQAVMGNNPSKSKDNPTHPVEMVSWDDIQPFLAKLNSGGLAGPWRFDLPTEAQWEYACRAGTTTTYSFGERAVDLAQFAWYDNFSRTHPVGQLKPNALGLYDLHGNVWEWCADWYEDGYYAKALQEDPPGPTQGSNRVHRGGSLGSGAANCRTGYRNASGPTLRWYSHGFRLALSPSRVPPEAGQAKTAPTTPAPAKPEVVSTPPGSPPALAVAPFKETEAQQHQQAWAKYLGEPVEREVSLPGNQKLLMILIPPGEFTRSEDNQRSFRVRLTKPFYLGKYEVTQAQWQAVMGNNPSLFKYSATHPVEQVSWNDIQPFLAKLNTGGAAGPWRFALPTEAQWEHACRAGTTTAYSFGDSDGDLSQYGWYQNNSGNKPHPVGQLKPNQFGLYDVHGNVWEWCADKSQVGYYAKAPQDDPPGPSLGSHRVYRGGSWDYVAAYCRTVIRGAPDPAEQRYNGGFRLALSPSRVPPEAGQAKPAPTTPAPAKPVVVATPPGSPPPLAVAPFKEAEAQQHQQACAKYLGQPVEREVSLPGDQKLAMILIPAGEFVREDRGKQFRVRLTQPFYLGKYEVTQAQWQAVMGNNPSRFKDSPTHPVEMVSWDDIQPFLAKLNSGGTAGPWRFALPTEAQWEYACRAGTTTAYSFGDRAADLAQFAWFIDNSGNKTHPVGQLKPNQFGLYDVHGNVWEWCADGHENGYYAKAPLEDPPGPSEGSSRVHRGGSWGFIAATCRLAFRFPIAPSGRGIDGGFRLALSPLGI